MATTGELRPTLTCLAGLLVLVLLLVPSLPVKVQELPPLGQSDAIAWTIIIIIITLIIHTCTPPTPPLLAPQAPIPPSSTWPPPPFLVGGVLHQLA